MRNAVLRRKMLEEFAHVLARVIHLVYENRLELAAEELRRLVVRMEREQSRGNG